MSEAALIHRTIESGDARLSSRSEVDPAVLAGLRPMIRDALATGAGAPLLDSGWWMRCSTSGGRLLASLWASRPTGDSRLPAAPDNGTAPHVTMTVTRPAGEGRPLLEASILGLGALSGDPVLLDEAAAEAGDLARCLAWAWLED